MYEVMPNYCRCSFISKVCYRNHLLWPEIKAFAIATLAVVRTLFVCTETATFVKFILVQINGSWRMLILHACSVKTC